MALTQEQIDAIIAETGVDEKWRQNLSKIMRRDNLTKEDFQLVRAAVMERVFRNKLNSMPLNRLQKRSEAMADRLRIVNEVIAEKQAQ